MKNIYTILLYMFITLFGCNKQFFYHYKGKVDNKFNNGKPKLVVVLYLQQKTYGLKDTLVFELVIKNVSRDEIKIYYHPYAIHLYRNAEIFHTGIQPIFPNVEIDNLKDALLGEFLSIPPDSSIIRRIVVDNLRYKITTHPGTVQVYALFRYDSQIDDPKMWFGSTVSNVVSINFVK